MGNSETQVVRGPDSNERPGAEWRRFQSAWPISYCKNRNTGQALSSGDHTCRQADVAASLSDSTLIQVYKHVRSSLVKSHPGTTTKTYKGHALAVGRVGTVGSPEADMRPTECRTTD